VDVLDNIGNWWANFLTHPTFWDAFWPSVLGALAGAVSAFVLERRYRERERIGREVGQCNRLIFTLGQMLSTLEDVNELLFIGPRKRLGREPQWHEIGGLPGAPEPGPSFVVGEYDFLLEDVDRKSNAPRALGRSYHAVSRFNSALALVHERTQLYAQWHRLSTSSVFGVGAEGVAGLVETETVGHRVDQLTRMLAEDVPEAVALFKEVIGELRQALSVRYRGREFIRLWPNDPNAPPV